jgi:hypothetical protein
MRQITSSVTFLPALQDKCACALLFVLLGGLADPNSTGCTDVFTILTYAAKDTEVPKEWIDSDPHMIIGNAEQVASSLHVLSRLSSLLTLWSPARSNCDLSAQIDTKSKDSSLIASAMKCFEPAFAASLSPFDLFL